MSQPQIVALISQIPPDDSNREFNCQTLVEAVLKRLSDAGYLLQEDYRWYSRCYNGPCVVVKLMRRPAEDKLSYPFVRQPFLALFVYARLINLSRGSIPYIARRQGCWRLINVFDA